MNTRLRLTRIYSLRSLMGIAVIAVVLVFFYRFLAIQNLVRQETSFNVSLAQSLSATLLPHYTKFMRAIDHMPAEALEKTPELQAMTREVVDKIRGLRVIKIKFYDARGLTVFSTARGQIGKDNSEDDGFIEAMQGRPASELVSRGHFSSFERELENVDVLSSYVPIQGKGESSPQGVFEIYSDVTPLIHDITRTSYTILAGVTALLLMLYAFLLAVVRRADETLRRYEEEQQQRQQAKLDYLAHYDALTDLANRSFFMAQLSDAIARARSSHTGLGLIHLSIDRFKLLNDGLGHEYGDRILMEFARRLCSCVSKDGIVARMGGDQFALMSEDLGTAKAARLCAEYIIAQANQPLQIAGREIILTVSLGLAALQPGGEDAELLVENAITAMRKAKDNGRNGFVFHTRQLDSKPQERLALEMDLRRALEQHEFLLYYQPRIDTASGHMAGMEALLRWQHPRRGLVAPMEFVPLLEDMDLMIPVGAWVIEEACRQTGVWHAAGYPHLHISVNLSLRQFRAASLVESVRHALAESGLPGEYLELELTESVLADDLDQAKAILRKLKALGVGIAIDDFGTGYSSLSYLIDFPVACLKIDRVFIANVPANKHHAALTTAIVAMADSLGLDTVAEGVETRDQFEFISALGCTEAQGYWFSPPRPAHEIMAFITDLEHRTGRKRIGGGGS